MEKKKMIYADKIADRKKRFIAEKTDIIRQQNERRQYEKKKEKNQMITDKQKVAPEGGKQQNDVKIDDL
jgi:hypothetical protein